MRKGREENEVEGVQSSIYSNMGKMSSPLSYQFIERMFD